MTNYQKLKELCKWLHEQGISDYIEHMVDETGLQIDLYLPSHNIAVHLSDGYNQVFYTNACSEYKPFFIRNTDSIGFVIEKMSNCLNGHTCSTAPKGDKHAVDNDRQKPEHHDKQDPRPQIKKRQRVRVNVQRVMPVKK